MFVLLAAAVPADGALLAQNRPLLQLCCGYPTSCAHPQCEYALAAGQSLAGCAWRRRAVQVLMRRCSWRSHHVACGCWLCAMWHPCEGMWRASYPTVGSGQVPVKLVVSPAPALAGHRMALMRPPDGAQDPAVFVCGMQPSIRPLCARVGGGWRARAPGQQQLVCVSPGQHLDSRAVSGEASAAVHGGALSAQGDSSTTKPSAVIIADRSIVERMEPSNSMLPQLLRS